MILIKLHPTLQRRNEPSDFDRWYAADEATGAMTLKPYVGYPTQAEFDGSEVFLDGIGTLAKRGIPSEVLYEFSEITRELLNNSKPGLGNKLTNKPKYAVVTRFLGTSTVGSQGISAMYFVNE